MIVRSKALLPLLFLLSSVPTLLVVTIISCPYAVVGVSSFNSGTSSTGSISKKERIRSHNDATGATTSSSSRQMQSSIIHEMIASYQPINNVNDQMRIDLDVKTISTLLHEKSDEAFQKAALVYQLGGYTRSYAVLHVVDNNGNPITSSVNFKGGTKVIGNNYNNNETIHGAIIDHNSTILHDGIELPTDVNPDILFVQYPGTSSCHVGGLPSVTLTGCFANVGNLIISTKRNISYYYEARTDNENARTIQTLSTTAWDHMKGYDANNEYYPEFKQFYDYYDDFDYANTFIEAALNGIVASFRNDEIIFDFTGYTYPPRGQAAEKGMVVLSILMLFTQQLGRSIDYCNNRCEYDDSTGSTTTTKNCTSRAVLALDEAVASYTGSLVGPVNTSNPIGNPHAFLMYTLADRACASFKTCGMNGTETSGTARVNDIIFNRFNAMQREYINNKDCTLAKEHKNVIVRLMYVPLIQEILRFAYQREFIAEQNEEGTTKYTTDEALGITFTAALLPLLHTCNETDADHLYSHMRYKSSIPKPGFYISIKRLLERNYNCLGITCTNVGGLWDSNTNTYLKHAGPCGTGGGSDGSSSPGGGTTDSGGTDGSTNDGSGGTDGSTNDGSGGDGEEEPEYNDGGFGSGEDVGVGGDGTASMNNNNTQDRGGGKPGLAVFFLLVTILGVAFFVIRRRKYRRKEEVVEFRVDDNLETSQVIL